jgi:hypothetical protein
VRPALVVRFAPDGAVKSYTLSTTFPDEKKKLDPAVGPVAPGGGR